jgi:hypothetical protein
MNISHILIACALSVSSNAIAAPLRTPASEAPAAPHTIVNVGLGLGVASLLRADIQLRNNPSRFWSFTASTSGLLSSFNASLNWKEIDGWNDSGYWLLGGGLVRLSINTLIFGTYSVNVPEVHGGWGYEWLTPNQTRHAIELRASYPEVASVHYLYGI